MYFFALLVAPIMLIIAIVTAFIPLQRAKRVLCFSIGELVGTLFWLTWLALLNTYAVPQR
jgi:hypothetical protein